MGRGGREWRSWSWEKGDIGWRLGWKSEGELFALPSSRHSATFWSICSRTYRR
jgi:hypothetical protein